MTWEVGSSLPGGHHPGRVELALDRTQRRNSGFADLGVQIGRVVAPHGVMVGDRLRRRRRSPRRPLPSPRHWSISSPRRARAMKVNYNGAPLGYRCEMADDDRRVLAQCVADRSLKG
jgi:hypothetical protein